MLAGPEVRTLSGASVSVGVGKPPNIFFLFFAKFVFRVELAKNKMDRKLDTAKRESEKKQNKLFVCLKKKNPK